LTSTLSFEDPFSLRRKDLRNGYSRGPSAVQEAFYKASMWHARVKGWMVNARVVGMTTEIFEAGVAKASDTLIRYGERSVSEWCPRLNAPMKDEDYRLYLGLNVVHEGGGSRLGSTSL
jgi:hypothetical protein